MCEKVLVDKKALRYSLAFLFKEPVKVDRRAHVAIAQLFEAAGFISSAAEVREELDEVCRQHAEHCDHALECSIQLKRE